MLENQKIAAFLTARRKKAKMTQSELAQQLGVSFQAVSKWENGTLPNAEILVNLARLLDVSVDEILSGQEKTKESFTYSRAGIDLSYTDSMKREMAAYLKTEDRRVLNGLGPFASLYDINFPEISRPVLVLKSEEPGSKQKLASVHRGQHATNRAISPICCVILARRTSSTPHSVSLQNDEISTVVVVRVGNWPMSALSRHLNDAYRTYAERK